MRILGLSFGFHDAGACMLQDDNIEFASHSERYSKVKNDPWINHDLINSAFFILKSYDDLLFLRLSSFAIFRKYEAFSYSFFL